MGGSIYRTMTLVLLNESEERLHVVRCLLNSFYRLNSEHHQRPRGRWLFPNTVLWVNAVTVCVKMLSLLEAISDTPHSLFVEIFFCKM